ncbi:MAG: hypothetical protein WAS05_07170 [Candidatus Nanopelagicales bacterium]
MAHEPWPLGPKKMTHRGEIQASTAAISGNNATWGSIQTIQAPTNAAGTPCATLSTNGTRATVVWVAQTGSDSSTRIYSS